MTTSLPADIFAKVGSLLQAAGCTTDNHGETDPAYTCELLKGDGSNRQFWRVAPHGSFGCIVVAPEKYDEKGLREATSVWKIGNHLRSAGVPVPELYGFDESFGVLVYEDLGDIHLHSVVRGTDFFNEGSVEELRSLYRQTVDVLVTMQYRGRDGFDRSWCWDGPVYDRELMLERESGYFLRAFWQGLLSQQPPDGLTAEFELLAGVAAGAPTAFFLHRDFQSRNVMIKDGMVRVIDFQAGRLGPLAYDLASLLLDPYADLPVWFQEELYEYYLQQLQPRVHLDTEAFHGSYLVLGLQRNLQILGAFSYLSAVSGKPFFRSYIRPSLVSLLRLLRQDNQPYLPVLTAMAEQAQQLLDEDPSLL